MGYTDVFHPFKCNLCGLPIAGCPQKWMNEYRAIYARGIKCDRPTVSGVAWASNDLAISVPPDSACRYDDEDASISSFVGVSVLQTRPNQDDEDPDGSPWGFLIHNACWQVLWAACYPEPLNVEFFFGLLRSFPLSTGHIVYWGHDYGHIYNLAFPGRRVTDENDIEDYVMLGLCGYATPAALRLYIADPFSPPGLHKMLDEAHRLRVDSITAEHLCGGRPQSVTDKFSTLPPELREQILCELPSPDVVNSLRASRPLHSICLSQTFWSSRFRRGFDFGHIFEASHQQKRAGRYCDYQSVYHSCRQHRSSSDIRSRTRIWSVVEPMATLMAQYNSCTLQGDASITMSEEQKSSGSSSPQWVVASGCGKGAIRTWARKLEYRGITIRKTFQAIDVSLINFHTLTFITGLRIVYSDGTKDQLGYMLSTVERIFDTETSTESNPKGFAVGTGYMGIHGIGVLGDCSTISKWVGVSEKDCNVQKLYTGNLSEIQGHFDVCCPSLFRSPLTSVGFQTCQLWSQVIGAYFEILDISLD